MSSAIHSRVPPAVGVCTPPPPLPPPCTARLPAACHSQSLTARRLQRRASYVTAGGAVGTLMAYRNDLKQLQFDLASSSGAWVALTAVELRVRGMGEMLQTKMHSMQPCLGEAAAFTAPSPVYLFTHPAPSIGGLRCPASPSASPIFRPPRAPV